VVYERFGEDLITASLLLCEASEAVMAGPGGPQETDHRIILTKSDKDN